MVFRSDAPRLNGTPRPAAAPAVRWRWYHFYFVLALFDVAVILVSVTLYHRTLVAYRLALAELGGLDRVQRWLSDLRAGVMEINAPGNDIFESRNVPREEARLDAALGRFEGYRRTPPPDAPDLTGFFEHVEAMVAVERTIFAQFALILGEALPDEMERHWFREATVNMASMDRHQALAFERLYPLERALLDRKAELLADYGASLERSAALEKVVFSAVLLILVGVFFYGRKLQRTHVHMLEEQQRALAERHERLAAVGEVCSAVAHGMRNPLASISATAQLAMRSHELDTSTRERLDDVLRESRRLDQRITRLLDFSRAPRQAFETLALQEVLDQAVHEVKPRMDEKGLALARRYIPQRLCVHGDRERLIQSVIELLSNCIDHVPAGGNVVVHCGLLESNPRYAAVSVVDDGPGIPRAARHRVFELFYTSKADGNGIGLASVKRVAELHGGSVEVVDTPGTGAHLRLVLPLASALEAVAAHHHIATDEHSGD